MDYCCWTMSVPTIPQFNELFPDDEARRRYLLDFDVFYRTYPCTRCCKPMRRIPVKEVFRCDTKGCDHRELSMRKGTFFFGSKLPCMDIMRIAHLWLAHASHQTSVLLTGHTSKTITSFHRFFRQLASSSLTV